MQSPSLARSRRATQSTQFAAPRVTTATTTTTRYSVAALQELAQKPDIVDLPAFDTSQATFSPVARGCDSGQPLTLPSLLCTCTDAGADAIVRSDEVLKMHLTHRSCGGSAEKIGAFGTVQQGEQGLVASVRFVFMVLLAASFFVEPQMLQMLLFNYAYMCN